MIIPYLRQAILAGILCSVGGTALAASLSDSDQQFMTKAAHAGQMEIQASALAEKLAASDEVKKFAEKMVADHTKADDELRKLADKKEVSLTPGLNPSQQEQLKALAQTEGAEFDRKYAQEIGVAAHEEAVNLFQTATEQAEDADVKAYAGKTLPHLKEHKEMANQLLTNVEKTR